MKISYNWLKEYIPKLPKPEKVADLLTMHSFETEVVGKVGKDYVLDVDVLPNRAHDCLSHLGIAQEIRAVTGVLSLLKSMPQQAKESKSQKTKDFLKIEVKDKNDCPRYTARMVIEVKVETSPEWLQERLKICGLRSINNIVDIANYVMLEIGQPLHAFDADKVQGAALVIRRAKKGEKITTLDDEKYDLDENILVIADEKKPICIAGIKGGKAAEIDRQTKRIILEAANFSSRIIRHGSQCLKLKTDASWRFENQLDPNLAEQAINRAAYLIQEIAGNQVLNGIIDVYPNKVRPKKIRLDIEQVRSLLGIDISTKEIKSILKRLGFEIGTVPLTASEGLSLLVTIPTRRLDISIPEDLIEEIGRLYGYGKITSQLPEAVLIPPKTNEDLIYQNKIKDILANLGFSEAYNYSFISEKDAINNKLQATSLIEIANPVSQEQKYLRPNLILNLLKNIRENKKYFEEVRLFEIGRVFQEAKETKRIGVILSLEKKSQEAIEFYRLKGIIDSLLNKLRISDVWYDDIPKTCNLKFVTQVFHLDRRAEIKVGNDIIGWLGEISPEVLEKSGIKSRAAGFELDFAKLVQLATEERVYSPPSKYPAMVRDIALLVEPGAKIAQVLNLIHSAGGSLIRDVDLFDIYEGEEIPEGKKSLAFHIIYQADDHTLTDKEVNQAQEKIIRALETEEGWEVRK